MDWLVVEPRSGQGPARLLVSVRATGLPAVGAGAIAGHVSVVVASGRFTSRETLNVVLTLHSAVEF